MSTLISNIRNIFNKKKQFHNFTEPGETLAFPRTDIDQLSIRPIANHADHRNKSKDSSDDFQEADQEEYEVVEREILPAKIICPDCGGITLEGLDFCDKCGGELL